MADKIPISDLCDEYGLQPSVLYSWQKQVYERLDLIFETASKRSREAKRESNAQRAQQQRITALEAKLKRKDGVIAEISEAFVKAKKRGWGELKGHWVPHDLRDQVVDFVAHWSERTGLPVRRFVHWIGVSPSKHYAWVQRYGLANEHNGAVPRDHWIEPWERQAIIDFHDQHPLDGYRQLTLMMRDAYIVAVSPSTTYRVLRAAGRLGR